MLPVVLPVSLQGLPAAKPHGSQFSLTDFNGVLWACSWAGAVWEQAGTELQGMTRLLWAGFN